MTACQHACLHAHTSQKASGIGNENQRCQRAITHWLSVRGRATSSSLEREAQLPLRASSLTKAHYLAGMLKNPYQEGLLSSFCCCIGDYLPGGACKPHLSPINVFTIPFILLSQPLCCCLPQALLTQWPWKKIYYHLCVHECVYVHVHLPMWTFFKKKYSFKLFSRPSQEGKKKARNK